MKGFRAKTQRHEEEGSGRQAPHPMNGAVVAAFGWRAASRMARHLRVFVSLRETNNSGPSARATPLFKRRIAV